MRWKRAWASSGNPLRGLAIASIPAPAFAQVATATLPRDLSPWGMFTTADAVVKAVLVGLAFASIVTWTVWLAKTIEIAICKRRVRAALNILAGVHSTLEGVERLTGTKGEVRQFLDAGQPRSRALGHGDDAQEPVTARCS
jgi:biopolymer transport protein ExbB